MNILTDDEDGFEDESSERVIPGRVARFEEEDDLPRRRSRDRESLFHRFERFDLPDRQFHWGPLAAAAAAGFVIAIVLGPCRAAHKGDDSLTVLQTDLQNSQSELQTSRNKTEQLESELSAARTNAASKNAAKENPAKADASERRATSETAEHAAPAPEVAAPPVPAPAARSEARTRTELTPEEVLRHDEMAKEAAPPPVTTSSAEASPPNAEPSPAPPLPTAPDPGTLAEPQQVATASVYALPEASGPAVRSSAQSGAPGVAVLQALAPERAGWTAEAQPTLYWHASEATSFPCEFKLVREGHDEPLVRVQLPAPGAAGIQRIELSQYGVTLDEGASYRWSVTLVDAENSGGDRATGGIRRVAPSEVLRPSADASASERLDALEKAGIWYDALDLVTRLIDRNPGAENLVARRNAMLAKVGVNLARS